MVFSNLLIALAAASQSLLTYYIFEIPVNIDVIILEWSATLLLYNFSLWISMPAHTEGSVFRRTIWFSTHKLTIIILSILATVCLLYALSQLHFYTFLLLFLIGFLSLGYTIPIVRIKNKLFSFRQVVGLKVFLIAIVWALSVVGMPVVEFLSTNDSTVINWASTLYWMLTVMVFIVGITLPFDVRDVKQDRYYNLKTIPVLIGEQKAKLWCYLLIIIHVILLLFAPDNLILHKGGLIGIDILVLYLFYTKLFRKTASYESVYLLDLILVVQFIYYAMITVLQ